MNSKTEKLQFSNIADKELLEQTKKLVGGRELHKNQKDTKG